ncbi:hypothetical protein CSKR_102196 [Clonorchis sinensis]|uniref:Uncharacterized protein n=1 Tax=Clonorchis sinensis TaxID=79923 RepID=A0A419PFH4_CLOSI|nr:hypothetical protein CSKR_102196 [Clonorchis sinensis]
MEAKQNGTLQAIVEECVHRKSNPSPSLAKIPPKTGWTSELEWFCPSSPIPTCSVFGPVCPLIWSTTNPWDKYVNVAIKTITIPMFCPIIFQDGSPRLFSGPSRQNIYTSAGTEPSIEQHILSDFAYDGRKLSSFHVFQPVTDACFFEALGDPS